MKIDARWMSKDDQLVVVRTGQILMVNYIHQLVEGNLNRPS